MEWRICDEGAAGVSDSDYGGTQQRRGIGGKSEIVIIRRHRAGIPPRRSSHLGWGGGGECPERGGLRGERGGSGELGTTPDVP